MGALLRWLNSVPPEAPAPPLPSVEEVRRRSLAVLADCTRPQDERIRGQLQRAATVQQLWLLRSDIFQAIARAHCEAEAARRVQALSSSFEGWLPPCMLAGQREGPGARRP